MEIGLKMPLWSGIRSRFRPAWSPAINQFHARGRTKFMTALLGNQVHSVLAQKEAEKSDLYPSHGSRHHTAASGIAVVDPRFPRRADSQAARTVKDDHLNKQGALT